MSCEGAVSQVITVVAEPHCVKYAPLEVWGTTFTAQVESEGLLALGYSRVFEGAISLLESCERVELVIFAPPTPAAAHMGNTPAVGAAVSAASTIGCGVSLFQVHQRLCPHWFVLVAVPVLV